MSLIRSSMTTLVSSRAWWQLFIPSLVSFLWLSSYLPSQDYWEDTFSWLYNDSVVLICQPPRRLLMDPQPRTGEVAGLLALTSSPAALVLPRYIINSVIHNVGRNELIFVLFVSVGHLFRPTWPADCTKLLFRCVLVSCSFMNKFLMPMYVHFM